MNNLKTHILEYAPHFGGETEIYMESLQLAGIIAKCMDDKKAEEIKVLDIGSLTSMADYFVICHGNSSTQMKAVADHVEEKLEELGIVPINRGSYGNEYWLLMDYADVVVHIFNRESRDFYGIENLWADAKSLDVDELLQKGSN